MLWAFWLFSFRVRMVLRMDWRGCMDRSNWWYMFLQNLQITKANILLIYPSEIACWGLELYNRREMLRAILTWNCRAEWKAPALGAFQSMKGCRTDLSSSASRSLEMPTASGSSLWAWNTVQHSLMRWPGLCAKQERQRRTAIFKLNAEPKNWKEGEKRSEFITIITFTIYYKPWMTFWALHHSRINKLSLRRKLQCADLLPPSFIRIFSHKG